jgi:hypothetical protein
MNRRGIFQHLVKTRFPWKRDLSHRQPTNSNDNGDGELLRIITHISSPGVTGITIRDGEGKPVLGRTPAQRTAVGRLDSIASSRIDYDALSTFNPGVHDLLRPLWSMDAFRERILLEDIPSDLPRTTISPMMRHLPDMIKYGVAFLTNKASIIMKLFTVEKKNGLLRLIQDCRPLNRLCRKPPKMPLASIHAFIAAILDAEWVGTCDGKSFFYQFALGEEIRPLFGAKIRGARGRHTCVTMASLPMGFSWAPFFAQSFANALVHDIGKAWVDNFIILAMNLDQYYQRRAELMRRARLLNVALDNTEPPPCSEITLLGIVFNLRSKSYRLSEDFTSKAASRINTILEGTWHEIIEILEAVGCIVWFCFVTKRPLCRYLHTMELLRAVARKGWNGTHRLSDGARVEFEALALDISCNEPRYVTQHEEPSVTVECDSSDDYVAYIIYNIEEVIYAHQRKTRHSHIFLNELEVAVDGVLKARQLGHNSVHLRGDNMAALIAITRKLSSNFTANKILNRIPCSLGIATEYVNTKENLADPYTRGLTLPQVPTTLDKIREDHELFKTAPKVGAQALLALKQLVARNRM